MNSKLLLLTPLLALGACNSQSSPEVVDTNPDPMANRLANAAPVELPPAIRSDKTFRCSDGSLVAVVFFQGDKQVNVRVPPESTPVRLTAPEAGQPFTNEDGWKVTGDEENVSVTQPGEQALTCHV